jgi:putative DNA-invertase from lambdoid prophage Rac
MNKCALYCRVSTDEQHTENQIQQLTEYANRRGLEIVRIYSENASAWKAGHQIELKRLRADAQKQLFDTVLVWSLDRLSRQGAATILTLVDTLKYYGVRIISLQEQWTDAPPAVAELLYSVFAWVAKMESERRSERTKAGMARAKKAGKHCGRPLGSTDTKKRKKRKNK